MKGCIQPARNLATVFRGLAGSGVLLSPVSAFAAETNEVVNTITSSPEIGESLVRVFGALVVVIALFLGAAWLFRNWQRLPLAQNRKSRIRILEAKSVGNRQSLFIVNCQGHELLLGGGPAGIRLLKELEPQLSEQDDRPFDAILDEQTKGGE